MAYFKNGKINEAFDDFTNVLKLDSNHAMARYARAGCYSILGFMNKALNEYTIALNYDKKSSRRDNSKLYFHENAERTLNEKLSDSILKEFMSLPNPPNEVQAEYVWIGGSGFDLRCKTRTLKGPISSVADLPEWNFDGSSTGQAPGDDSEVILKPVKFFNDPFRPNNSNILVMCDCYKPDGTPLSGNTRFECAKVMLEAENEKPWFGIEQEYTLFNSDGSTPYGWPKNGFPGPQGPYYCSVGAENAFGRHIAEAHYKACLYAGITISGINGEVMPGQWEYQVGPCEGTDSGDMLWMSRYIMSRVCERFGVIVSFDPKPIPGDWNGAGCHTNFSTLSMRTPNGGYQKIIDAIEKLKPKHQEHIDCYGSGNERRLTGMHETADIRSFSYGVANRGCSVRIPRQTEANGYGYFEDRRPASNMDPYVVTKKLVETCVLDVDKSSKKTNAVSNNDVNVVIPC